MSASSLCVIAITRLVIFAVEDSVGVSEIARTGQSWPDSLPGDAAGYIERRAGGFSRRGGRNIPEPGSTPARARFINRI